MHDGMRRIAEYRMRAVALPLGVFAYVAIALSPPPTGSLETFPFFNWSLFSQTSDKKLDVVAIIRSVDGKPLSKPAFFYDMKDRFAVAAAKNSRFAKTIDRLAFAILSNDEEIERRTRDLVEKHYFRESGQMEYDIAMILYDPLERYRTGKIDKVKVLRRYSKND